MEAYIAKNISDVTFDNESYFERCNVINCTFNARCHFDKCNIIRCHNLNNCEWTASNIINEEKDTQPDVVFNSVSID